MLDHREPITIETAQERINNINLKTKTETIQVNDALNRTLAQEIKATRPLPSFRRSGYDGYAIRGVDDHDFPKTFKVMGEVQAGATYDAPLGENQTVRIMTGACVPDNADKVIMLEQTRVDDPAATEVTIMTTSKNTNITEIGSEFHTNDHLLNDGQVLNPGAISLLLAFGFEQVLVYAQPRVAIISTGTELLQPGQAPAKGKIFNSNGPLLAGLVTETGGVVTTSLQIPDDYPLLQETLNKVVADNDLVLTTGGVSVGDYDFLALVAKDSQVLLFNKLKMRPGSVTTAFIYHDTPIMALSGNPGACFTGFYLFVEALIRRFTKQPSRLNHQLTTLERPYAKTNGYDRILRGVYRENKGHYYVQLVGSDQSGALGNLHLTTCLFEIPHSNRPIQQFAQVQTWFLPFR